MSPSNPIPHFERPKIFEVAEEAARRRFEAAESAARKRRLEERRSSSHARPIVKSEDFRAGFPDLAKLPVETRLPTSTDRERINIRSPCISVTAAIFEQSGLKYDEIHVNITKGKGGTIFHPTITFRVPNSDDEAFWVPLLIKTRNMLKEESFSDIHVMIMEPRGDMLPHVYNTIAYDHPIVNMWNEKLGRLVLKVLTSVKIAELCVWNYGLTEEAAEPTVLIVIEDTQEHRWDILTKRILEVCADHGAAYLKVAVVEGKGHW